MKCKHGDLIIIERVIVEKFFHFDDGKPPKEGREWDGDPVLWFNPQPLVMIVTCPDCGFERFYGPQAKRPKWVQAAWKALEDVNKFSGVE